MLTSDYNTNDVFPNINSYKDLWNAGLGRVNTLVEDVVYDADAWAEGNYTVKPYMTRDGKKWDKTTDNFYQNHNILSFAWTPSEHWSHNMALHYTYGRGYYKEFKKSTSLAKKFGMPEDKDLKDDAIRKKGLTQNCYGMVYNVNFKNDNWDVIGGVNLQQFSCNHWGYVTYIGSQALEQKYLSNGKYKYYDSDADKYDYSGFLKATYSFLDHWNVFADLQYRYVKYKTDGLNDRFVKKDGKYVNQELNINDDFNFFNPKAGVSYTNGGHKAYASVAMANREPERNNYTDNYNYPYPKNEKVIDVEAGYQYVGSNWNVGANFYYMDYDNQLVQTGEQSDIGEALTTNVKKSYRMGVELNAGWAPLSWLSVEGNAALSKNKIKDFDEFVESWDASENYVHQNHYSNSTLAYSPSAILNGFIDFHHKGFTATWHTNFVSKQYIDNSESDVRSLPCYSQSDLQLRYTSDVTKAAGIKNVTLGLDFNNVFSRHYAASGSTWYGWYTGGQRYQALAYVPMAGFNVMGHLTLKF